MVVGSLMMGSRVSDTVQLPCLNADELISLIGCAHRLHI